MNGSGADRVLKVGTRASALALTQSGWAAVRIAETAGGSYELVHVRTEGDTNLGPLSSIGGTGVFVTAVRTALTEHRCDAIVHSFKDLPTLPADGIAVAVVPPRENPADVLCARDGLVLDKLPRGATVGTGSPRRAAQLLARRPDLNVVPVRGNVDTRLGLVTSGSMDAVVLAHSGLSRLGRLDSVTEVFAPEVMLPAPSQGALAVECRTDDLEGAWYSTGFAALDDPASRAAAVAERALLNTLEAGCTAPVGALGVVEGDRLTLTALVISPDGRESLRGELTGAASDAAALGQELAADLLGRGAAKLLG